MVNASGVHHPKRVLKYSATVLVVALFAYAVFLVAQSWREAKAGQAGQLETIADLSGVAIDTYLTQLEIGMRNLGAELVETGDRPARNKPDYQRAYTQVSRFQQLHSELGNVILIRGDGQVLLTGTNRNSRDMPTLARDAVFMEFRAELTASRPFAIGRPVMGTIDKRWVTAARYAVTGRDGKLAYIISANLPSDMLQRYRVDSTSPMIAALGLIRDDDYLVSRYPEPDAANRDDVYGKPAAGAMIEYLRANKYPQHGQVELRDSNGRVKDLRALRRLQHYPLTLFVEMPMSEVKAAWWSDMHAPYVVVTLLLACMFAFYAISQRHRRNWSMSQRREELRRSYEEALHERNPDQVFMFDAQTLQFSHANDIALEYTGYTLEQLQQKNIFALHGELDAAAFGALIEPLRRSEQEAIKYQTVQVRADGTRYPVEVNLQLMTLDDGVKRFMMIVTDISALKQAEENIRTFNAPVERRASGRSKMPQG